MLNATLPPSQSILSRPSLRTAYGNEAPVQYPGNAEASKQNIEDKVAFGKSKKKTNPLATLRQSFKTLRSKSAPVLKNLDRHRKKHGDNYLKAITIAGFSTAAVSGLHSVVDPAIREQQLRETYAKTNATLIQNPPDPSAEPPKQPFGPHIKNAKLAKGAESRTITLDDGSKWFYSGQGDYAYPADKGVFPNNPQHILNVKTREKVDFNSYVQNDAAKKTWDTIWNRVKSGDPLSAYYGYCVNGQTPSGQPITPIAREIAERAFIEEPNNYRVVNGIKCNVHNVWTPYHTFRPTPSGQRLNEAGQDAQKLGAIGEWEYSSTFEATKRPSETTFDVYNSAQTKPGPVQPSSIFRNQGHTTQRYLDAVRDMANSGRARVLHPKK